MDDLKPCPFCGGEGKMGYVRDGLRVHCRLCFASGPSAFHGRPEDASTQERAIAAWNRRAAAIEALQAQLAEARDKALPALDMAAESLEWAIREMDEYASILSRERCTASRAAETTVEEVRDAIRAMKGARE